MPSTARTPKPPKPPKPGKTPKPPKPAKKDGRLKQMFLVYKMTRKTDRRIGLILLGVFLLAGAVAFGIFYLILPGSWIITLVTSVLLGLLAALAVFGRRAQKAQYA